MLEKNKKSVEKNTKNKNSKTIKAKNRRMMLLSKYEVCHSKKSKNQNSSKSRKLEDY